MYLKGSRFQFHEGAPAEPIVCAGRHLRRQAGPASARRDLRRSRMTRPTSTEAHPALTSRAAPAHPTGGTVDRGSGTAGTRCCMAGLADVGHTAGIDLCGANSVVVPLPTLSGPGSLADRTASIGWVRPSAGICSPAAAEAASTTTPDCPCRTPPVRIKGDIERSAGTGWPQSYLLAIWMRLPQVSSSTAMVTPPMSTGSWVKRTPSARSRSNSARALSTASDVNGMPFSSAAFLGDPAGQRRLVHVQLAGDLRDRAARIQHQRR